MIRILIFLLMGQISLASEGFDPKVKSDFLLIEEQLETTLFSLCSWDEKTFNSQNPNEFYGEMYCEDGSYHYKFGVRLVYGIATSFRAEGHALSDSGNWYCVAKGEIVEKSVHSEMACSQIK